MSTQLASASGRSDQASPPVIDYEGSQYRTDFWEGQGRQYEDATERLALDALVPKTGTRIAEIGAGFGRLADLYLGYEQIVLFDYSRTLLQDAANHWGDDSRFVFVAGNIYELPLATAVLDTVVMVRVMHHLADVEKALAQIRRSMHSDSVAVLEYANKRNLKSLARWAARRQPWSPMEMDPVEFVELNFDFHPRWMTDRFEDARLDIERQFAVSHFRLPALKNNLPADALAKLDSCLFELGGNYPLSPSVFVRATTAGATTAGATTAGATEQPAADGALDDLTQLFRCPTCAVDNSLEAVSDDSMRCQECGAQYGRTNGVWDFKERLN